MTTYNKENLEELSIEDIIPIFNHYSEKLGTQLVENFASKEEAVHQTLTIIEQFEDKEHSKSLKNAVIKALLPSEPKKITPSLLRTITVLRAPGEGEFSKRFDRYTTGMTVLDVIRTEGVCQADVYEYVRLGVFSLSEIIKPVKEPKVAKPKANKENQVDESENQTENTEGLVLEPEDLVG
jgi:hypothetical protein